MLSAGEIDRYHRDGYVIARDFQLTHHECARLQADLEAVLQQNSDIPPDRLVNVHLEGKPPSGAAGASGFEQLARDPRTVDLVEQLIGPDLTLWLTHLFCKPAAIGREVPWHQDGQYWPIQPAATCTVWVCPRYSGPGQQCHADHPRVSSTRPISSHH